MQNYQNVPSDVLMVHSLMLIQHIPVDAATYAKCKKIVDNNPLYFPWEAKYHSIPKEVHEAYNKEIDPNYGEPIDWTTSGTTIDKNYKGLIPTLMEMGDKKSYE